MLDELLLLSGNDIPFYQAGVSIHQPRLKEIGYIGENNFHIGSHFLVFSKNDLPEKDKVNLENQSDFDIFMSVMNSRDKAKHKTDALMILALLFPSAKIKIEKDKILLQLENFSSSINKNNFNDFKQIINEIFCLNISVSDEGNYNPADDLAAKIAEKIKKAKVKKNGLKEGNLEKISVYSKYISILSVGLQKNINDLLEYTIYQLRDEFKRFRLKQDFDVYIQAKLAGVKDLEEVDNWMEDIHP